MQSKKRKNPTQQGSLFFVASLGIFFLSITYDVDALMKSLEIEVYYIITEINLIFIIKNNFSESF